jgi:hypothetical protein
VEPVPFPFRFGVGAAQLFQFAFDHAGRWLLLVTADGMLYATRTDGSGTEVLPRGVVKCRVCMGPWHKVLGVAGGFVVAGVHYPDLVALHYDFGTRTCKAHCFKQDALSTLFKQDAVPTLRRDAPVAWWYLRKPHTLILHQRSGIQCVHLGTGSRDMGPTGRVGGFPGLDTVPLAVDDLEELPLPPQGDGEPADLKAEWSWPWLYFSPSGGTLIPRHVVPEWQRFTPLADGRTVLRGSRLVAASCQGHTLAALFHHNPGDVSTLHLFRGPDGVPAGQFTQPHGLRHFALSGDGRLLARQVRSGQAEVRDVPAGGPPRCHTPRGRFHHGVAVELGECWLSLEIGKTLHLICWDQGRLSFSRGRGPGAHGVKDDLLRAGLCNGGVRARDRSLPDFLNRVNSGRFRAAAQNNLTAVVDAFGEVALFEPDNALVCMVFAFQEQVAAWMPDGTCYGPEALLGQRATPGALETIGRALKAAWDRSASRR